MLCCLMDLLRPLLDASLLELVTVIGSLLVVFAVAFIIFIKSTTKPLPEIHVFDSEKTFVAFKDSSTENVAWESALLDGDTDENQAPHLSIVVPAYNEEDRLPKMLDETLQFLSSKDCLKSLTSYEIIIADDGSKDKTTQVALAYAKKMGSDKIRVLTLAKNLGKGGAVRRGMLVSRGAILLYADADGATDISELNKVANKLSDIEEDGHGLVCGSRAHLEEESVANRSMFRTILMYGFHGCVRMFGCDTVKDTQCGFKLMTRATARKLFYSMHIERWAFDVELIKIAAMCKFPVAEVAVKWTEIDGSKLDPLSASLQMLKDLFFLWAKYLVGAWKLRSFDSKKIQ